MQPLTLALLAALAGCCVAVNYTCQSMAYINNAAIATQIGTCFTSGTPPTKVSVKACKKSLKSLLKANKLSKKTAKKYLKCLGKRRLTCIFI